MRLWDFLTDENVLNLLLMNIPFWILISLIIVTVYLLSKGADWMIDGAVSLALRTRLPQILVGATILSLGTTMPETFVSVMAAMMGNPGLALGNGVGSIIADTGLIFGFTILVTGAPLSRWILNRTGWWQIGSGVLLVVFAVTAYLIRPESPVISRSMGSIFIFLLIVYLWMNYRWAKSGRFKEATTKSVGKPLSLRFTLILLLGGLFFVILASRLLIPTAVETARRLMVPEDVIAATMVALGTSLPELVTAITAIRKGCPEITIGNIIGADVLNVLFVIGSASLAIPLAIPSNFFRLHFPTMLIILISFRLFIGTSKKSRFKRWQGALLLLIYLAYITLQYTIM